MTTHETHNHVFLGHSHDRNARRTQAVVLLTALMMVAEIVGGWYWGSMALLADGFHMGTHAGALAVAALAYAYARRHATNRRFSFGTGKVGDLAAFASAIGLGLIALLIGAGSVERLISPVPIGYVEALIVAVVGLIVNLLSAVLLHEGHGHSHAHEGHHDCAGHHHKDQNLRAAYLHVLADALTSVMAILALLAGWMLDWTWMDPMTGIVAAVVITWWAVGLMRDTARPLLDMETDPALARDLKSVLESDGASKVTDFHLWRVGPGHYALMASVHSPEAIHPHVYKERLAARAELSHVTIEVNSTALV